MIQICLASKASDRAALPNEFRNSHARYFIEAWEHNPNIAANGMASAIGMEYADYEPVMQEAKNTPDSICLLVDNKLLLTGYTLFVSECGRTDLSGGNYRSMCDCLFNKLLKLSEEVEVYPGHDYGSKPSSTIGEEKRSNYTLQPKKSR